MRKFSIGVILTLMVLASIAAFQTVNNSSPSVIESVSKWTSDRFEEMLLNALQIDRNDLGYGLSLPDPTFMIDKDANKTILIISGFVNNTTSNALTIPVLRGAILNTKSEEIFVWTYEADSREAAAGESVAYTSRVENPPVGAVGFSVTFTNK